MKEKDRTLLIEIFASVLPSIKSVDEFLHAWIFDAGYDFEGTGLNFDDLKRIWDGATTEIDWHSIGFVAGEQLAFYAATPLSREDIPRWIFSALLIRDAIENGYSDWGVQEGLIAQLLNKSEQITPQQKQQIELYLGHSFEGIEKIYEIGRIEIWGHTD